jgi:hypothetical protein
MLAPLAVRFTSWEEMAMRVPSFPLALTAVALAACTGVSVVQDQRGGPYGSEEYAKVGSEGPLPVVVYGSAAGASGPLLANTVVQNMAGADWGYHARFVPAVAPAASSVYWYVMMFDPPGVTTAEACARDGGAPGVALAPVPPSPAVVAPTGGAADTIRLAAGLCRYDKIATSVQARAGDVQSINDPKVRSLVRTAVLELTRPNQSRFDRSRDSGGGNNGGGGGGGSQK